MPARWRNCLAGRGEIDLRGVSVLSDRYYLWTPTTPRWGSSARFLRARHCVGAFGASNPRRTPRRLSAHAFGASSTNSTISCSTLHRYSLGLRMRSAALRCAPTSIRRTSSDRRRRRPRRHSLAGLRHRSIALRLRRRRRKRGVGRGTDRLAPDATSPAAPTHRTRARPAAAVRALHRSPRRRRTAPHGHLAHRCARRAHVVCRRPTRKRRRRAQRCGAGATRASRTRRVFTVDRLPDARFESLRIDRAEPAIRRTPSRRSIRFGHLRTY